MPDPSDASPTPDPTPPAAPAPAGDATTDRDATPDATRADGAHRSGYVALIGAPNVGKSTLLNRLLGTKLSIVSPRPSTTRNRVLGILSAEPHEDPAAPAGYQIVFLDTPGVVRPRYRMHDLMMRDVDRALSDADVAVFLADVTARRPSHEAVEALGKLARFSNPILLALNKADTLPSDLEALPLVDTYRGLLAQAAPGRDFADVLPVSALHGAGVDTLQRLLVERMPPGPAYYPTDQLSEHPERFFVGEIVREAVFHRFRDEVPYSTQVVVVQLQERPGQKDYVAADIVVERDSQKAILIGKGGKALKHLGQAARREIEAFLDRPVYLQLYVKTRADWRNRDGHLKEYGFGQ